MIRKSNQITGRKAALMSSVSAAVVVAGLAGSYALKPGAAMAADVDVNLLTPTLGSVDAQVSAETALASDVVNSALVEALIEFNNVTTETGTGATTTPIVTNSGLTVDGNTATANAIGNVVDSEADITAVTLTGAGIGVGNAMANTATAEVRSEVLALDVGFGLGADTTGDVTGSSVSVSRNSLNALTQLNVARTVVDETTLANEAITSTTAGTIGVGSGTTTPAIVSATGEIAVVTSQFNLSVDDVFDLVTDSPLEESVAIIALNDIGIEFDGETAEGSFTVDSNELLAEFRGNESNTGVDASAATSFEGSISVANQQINNFLSDPAGVYTEAPTTSAWVFGNEIIADFTEGAAPSTLDGSVSVSSNSTGADAIGNLGSSFITFDAGTDLIGADGGADDSALAQLDSYAEPTTTSADLTLVNQQANASFATSGRSVFNQVGVTFDDIAADSSVTVDQNEVFANATGNSGVNAIIVNANQIDATAALSSAQTNARRAVGTTDPNDAGIAGSADTLASVDTAIIGVQSTDFPASTTINDSSIDVTMNTVNARAEGNVVNNTVSLTAASNLTAGDPDSDASVSGGFNLTSTPSDEPASADGGAVLSNFQGLSNSLTDASVTDSVIGVTIASTSDVTGSDITIGGVDLNGDEVFSVGEMTRMTATAIGQTGLNSLSLSSEAGTLATAGAALSSFQIQAGQDADNPSGTFASVTDSIIGIDLDLDGETLLESAMTVTGADVSATAQGNRVTNDVMVSANTFDAYPVDDINIDLNDLGDAQVTPVINAESNSVILANTQISNASTGATIEDIQLGTILDGNVQSSSIIVDGNRVIADAIGNLVASQSPGNSLTLDIGTLALDAHSNETVAVLANVQDLTGRPGTTTTVTADVDDVFFDNDVSGNALNADLSASSNTLTARAMGNMTTENFLNVIGGNISYGGGEQDSDIRLGLVDTSTTQVMSPMDVELDSEAGFVIANIQRGSVDGVEATAGTDVGIGADVTLRGDLTSSDVDVSSNRFEALAFDNSGANTIQFGETESDGSVTPVTTLATDASIMSQQISAGDIVATLGQPGAAGTPAVPASLLDNINFNGTDLGVNTTSGNQLVTYNTSTGTLVIAASTLSGPERTALLEAVNLAFTGGSTNSNAILNGSNDIVVTFDESGDQFDAAGFNITNLALVGAGQTDSGQFFVGGEDAQDPIFAIPTITANIDGDITNSSVDVSSNVNQAVARANSVTNTLDAVANNLTGNTDTTTRTGVRVYNDGSTTDPGIDIDTSADNQLSTLQTRDPGAEVTATAFAGVGISTSLEEAGDSVTIIGSDLAVNNNVLSATAEGNVASNRVSADATTIGTGVDGDSPMASALSNVQVSFAGGSATAGQVAADPDTFLADLFAPIAVENSEVSISGNTTQATTTLNSASNTVDVTGVNVLSTDESLPGQALFNLDDASIIGGFSFGEALTMGDATLSNIQASVQTDTDDLASATAVMNIGNTDALVADTNGLTSSSIVVDNNRAQATVVGNTASNTVSQNGDASLDSASALASIQYADIAIDANSTLDARLELSSASVTPHSDSSVSMSGNVNLASGTANTAQNRVMASGANINGPVLPIGSGLAFIGELTDDTTTPVLGTLVDYDSGAVGSSVASNLQFSDADVDVDAITNILHQDTALTSGITGTSMMQDNNLTIAEAVGNLSGPNTRRTSAEQLSGTFGDTISIMGGNVDGAAVALSYQEGNGNIDAQATVDIVNNMVGTGLGTSMVSLSGNQTAAYATQNDATMSVVVDGTSIAGIESDTFAGFGNGTTAVGGSVVNIAGLASVGDNVIVGQQSSIGESITSDVTMTVSASQDAESGATVGASITNSSLSIMNNTAESSAAGNRASYSLSLNAASTLTATGAVSNAQFNSAGVSATATMTAQIENGLSFDQTLGQSSAVVSDNATVARARGNTGTNILNVAAGSGINTGTGITSAFAGTASGINQIDTDTVDVSFGTLARADYAVMSAQQNTGPINASITGGTGQILNNGAINNSSVRVYGNVMSADAVGNSVSNRIVTTSMNNANTTYGLANFQTNSGNVTSAVSAGNFGVVGGSMTNSASSVSNNSISARSVGNSAVNRISGN